jgi:glutathione S-transferase
MKYTAIVAALTLIEYAYIAMRTGQARQRYGVKAPATTGDPLFERHYRVQQNSVEQLVIFVPALFLCAAYVSDGFAALLGLVFIAGRFLYARSYIADPETRGPGFAISFAASAVLLLTGLIGAVLA